MRIDEAARVLSDWDRRSRNVYTKRDLAKLFREPTGDTLNETIKRLVTRKLLIRAARGVYVYALSSNLGPTTIEDVAEALRRGEYNFESLESALSQWGAISQVPIDRITVMTTGRKGEFKTPFGVIEFTHTASSPVEILANVERRDGHPLPIATREYALVNLRRVGRNLDLIVREGEDDE